MSANKATVTRYMEAYSRHDHAAILACLTEDVVWEVPGFYRIEGKVAFDGHIEGPGSAGPPKIRVTRLTEENDVVIAEGSVEARMSDGATVRLVFCDVFEMKGGLIRRLVSYLMQLGAGSVEKGVGSRES
jgi:ketosteroid isomerase-like protein